MRRFKIKITNNARTDLLNIYDYIKNSLENPNAAEKYKSLIYERINELVEIPYGCERCEVFGLERYRIAHVKGFRIIYTVYEETEVVSIEKVMKAGKNFTGI